MKTKFHVPELDALRFWAFASVFACHFGERFIADESLPATAGKSYRLFVALAQAGGLGVDLFFCLSSFLITTILLKECDVRGGDFRLGDFFWRRCLRIWPLYFTFILVFMVWLPLESTITKGRILMDVFFLGNLSYMLWPFGMKTASHLWSVSMEEQFYTVWAFVLKFKPKALGLTRLCLYGLVFTASFRAYSVHKGWPLWSNAPARLDSILAGILFADLIRKQVWAPSGRARLIMFVAGLVLPLVLLYVLGGLETRRGWWSMLFYPVVAFSCLCQLGAVYGQRFVTIPGWIAHLGKISYGLYVFHVPMLFSFDALLPWTAKASVGIKLARAGSFFLCSALGTLVVAMASYKWLELPFLKLKDRRFSTISSGGLPPDSSGKTETNMPSCRMLAEVSSAIALASASAASTSSVSPPISSAAVEPAEMGWWLPVSR